MNEIVFKVFFVTHVNIYVYRNVIGKYLIYMCRYAGTILNSILAVVIGICFIAEIQQLSYFYIGLNIK